ncbi:MAG: S1 RNA-binding domain-containing protein, partial [Chloroflexota bacterium]
MTEDRSTEGDIALSTLEGDSVAESQGELSHRPAEEMQILMDSMDADFRSPQRGQVIEGTVVSIDKDGVLVDISTKSEGLIPSHEVQAAQRDDDGDLEVGSRVLVYVVQPEDREG